MPPPPTQRNGGPGQPPGTPAANPIPIPATAKPENHPHTSRNNRSVTGHRANVLHRRLSSTVFTGSAKVTKIVTTTVPRHSREYDALDRAWIIYGTRIDSLLEAFKAAGVQVNELGGGR